MEIALIGIFILSVITASLLYKSNISQGYTNNMSDSDIQNTKEALKSLQQEFTQYQIETEKKLSEIEKKHSKEINQIDRKLNKNYREIKETIPKEIKDVIGHIEFARPLDGFLGGKQ